MTPEEIKHRLKDKGLKQSDLCKRLKKSPAAIHYLIHGKFKSDNLEKRLARILGVKLDEFRKDAANQN